MQALLDDAVEITGVLPENTITPAGLPMAKVPVTVIDDGFADKLTGSGNKAEVDELAHPKATMSLLFGLVNSSVFKLPVWYISTHSVHPAPPPPYLFRSKILFSDPVDSAVTVKTCFA